MQIRSLYKREVIFKMKLKEETTNKLIKEKKTSTKK